MSETTTTDTQAFFEPPPALLTEVTDPTSNQTTYAFPLQTKAWLKLQDATRLALSFPTSNDQFTSLFGTFTDEGTVETAVGILSAIQATATSYGDPLTLISKIQEFEQADAAPDTIYANAVWLAQQTELTAQQIGSLLQEGLDEIGTESDPQTRIDDLKDLLTGQGGVTSLSTTLKNEIDAFQGKVSSFYTTLNTELNGDTNSLKWYLGQSSNVLVDAKQAVAADQTQIDKLTRNIKTLNDEYIGFTTAASVSPLFFLFPFFGIFLAIADAATFGVLATQTKTALDQARQDLSTAEDDDQKKAALVTQLSQFDDRSQDVETDGKDFLDAIGQLTSGWDAFEAQINLRLQSLTADDVADWGKFMDTTNFETAKDGWKLIETTAESFRDAGFAQFSIQASP